MKYRTLGRLGWRVSVLGFGTMRFPSVKYDKSQVDYKRSIELIRYGIDQGINYIDTAWNYHFGDSEKIVGIALTNGYRERSHLVTKLPINIVENEDQFEHFLKNQLTKLQTKYLDAYLFHAVNRRNFMKIKKLRLIEKMEEAKKKGLIRGIGFSFHDNFEVFKEVIDYFDWDIAQIQYNYLDEDFQATTHGLSYASDKGIPIIVMEPLKGGILANPPKPVLTIINSAKIKKTPADWAFQYVWNRPEVSIALSGMNSKKIVDNNIESANQARSCSLKKEEMDIIQQIKEEFDKAIGIPCVNCKYCMPCPQGVDIPANFGLFNKLSQSRNPFSKILIQKKYDKLTKRSEEKIMYKGDVSFCINCGKCVLVCPQKINIPERLKEVAEVF
jgi:uncharacterized protein